MERRAYYDAEPRYKKEKTQDWYQQKEKTNQGFRDALGEYLSSKQAVLEVGCGGGWLAEFILKAGVKSYAGFDFSETAVNNSRVRLANYEDAKVWRGDALSAQPYTKKYNLIVAHQFLHCLVGKDRIGWLKSCASALYPDGVLIFSSSIGIPAKLVDLVDSKTKKNKPGNRYFAEEIEVLSEIEQAGFELEEVLHPENHSAIFVVSPNIA